jgi:hypothetical protein
VIFDSESLQVRVVDWGAAIEATVFEPIDMHFNLVDHASIPTPITRQMSLGLEVIGAINLGSHTIRQASRFTCKLLRPVKSARCIEEVLRSTRSPGQSGTLIAKEYIKYRATKLRREGKKMKAIRRGLHAGTNLIQGEGLFIEC